jgi:peptidylprolyl isomerase
VRSWLITGVLAIIFVVFYIQRTSTVGNYKENIKIGATFLEQNALKDGVIATDTGMQYKVLSRGTGTVLPKPESHVTVNYQGTLIDGTVFDSSFDKKPVSFVLNETIPGWKQGMQLMRVGDKFRLFIPSTLGYHDVDMGKIPAGSLLIFDVELISINNLDVNEGMPTK